MDNIIYTLYDKNKTKLIDENIECRKIGSTQYIKARMKVYQTGFHYPVPLECYYKINKNCYEIDEMIKLHFDTHRIINKGIISGTEFYDASYLTLARLEIFFKENNIIFTRYENNEIINELNKPLNETEEDNIYTENKNKKKYKNMKESSLRDKLQNQYLDEINNQLLQYKKCFIKAPTGFGKTHLYYKNIHQMKYNKILFLTPRILLNEQIVEDKYSYYIKHDKYNIIHYSNLPSSEKKNKIKKIAKTNNKLIMTCCYQSCKKLLKYIKKYNLFFDIIIFDEAHFITSWIETNYSSDTSDEIELSLNSYLSDDTICEYKLFGSATPTDEIENNKKYFGQIIEKVKVYELIKNELLCDIQTIIKKMNNKKKEYHNLKELIVDSMNKYNKKKGIIYVNDTTNAHNLYKLMKKQNDINTYIYVSKELDVEEIDTSINAFENDINKCIIIVVGKLGYGYDNDYIDFICLGDPRQSDIDIRQILGRGLRWNKKTYPNKLLHLLVPLYKDEFGDYNKNEHLKKYLDYIIGEFDKDIIYKSDGTVFIGNKNKISDGKIYDGETCESEILNEYCTTGYNKFTDFQRFLRNNNVYDEESYNKLKQLNEWMQEIGHIHTKYPKFCFRNIHPYSNKYYWDRSDAEQAYEINNEKLINLVGKDKYRRYDSKQKLIKINELDNMIPIINFDLYYN